MRSYIVLPLVVAIALAVTGLMPADVQARNRTFIYVNPGISSPWYSGSYQYQVYSSLAYAQYLAQASLLNAYSYGTYGYYPGYYSGYYYPSYYSGYYPYYSGSYYPSYGSYYPYYSSYGGSYPYYY